MSKFSSRSKKLEIMDDLSCSGKVVDQTLREIDSINHWLGGNKVTLTGLKSLLSSNFDKSISISDLGCGSGEMLKLIHADFLKSETQAVLTGYDANPNIIEYAKQNCKSCSGISFRTLNVLSESFRNEKFDVVLATLFFHHFTNDELSTLLKSLANQTKVGIVINDLHRHPLAYYSIRLLTLLFSNSSMVKYDAPLSVLRGFTRDEWVVILQKAEIKNYSLKWKWAFRWQIIIETGK